MNTDILKQFDMTRDILLTVIESVSETDADLIPDGFNNNIRWHIGHILFAANNAFMKSEATSYLPPDYVALFKIGSSPKEWNTEVPSLNELIEKLQEQKVKIREVFASRMEESLATPLRINVYGGHEFVTVGEMMNFFIFHEGMHIGFINALKRVIQ